MKVFFTGDELKMVDKVKGVESWADVVAVANEIYAYSKDEQADLQELQDFDFDNGTADDIIVPELKEYSVTWIVNEVETVRNTYKLERLAFSKEHIKDMIEDYEFDFTDGDVVGTKYIDGDIQSSRLSDIEEIEDI